MQADAADQMGSAVFSMSHGLLIAAFGCADAHGGPRRGVHRHLVERHSRHV